METLNALSNAGENIPRNRAGARGEFCGGDLLVAIISNERGRIAWPHIRRGGNIDDDLIHRHTAENRAVVPMEKSRRAIP